MKEPKTDVLHYEGELKMAHVDLLAKYQVVVVNVGTIYFGNDRDLAFEKFKKYTEGGYKVAVLADGDIIKEN